MKKQAAEKFRSRRSQTEFQQSCSEAPEKPDGKDLNIDSQPQKTAHITTQRKWCNSHHHEECTIFAAEVFSISLSESFSR
jgi:hypothetical protein